MTAPAVPDITPLYDQELENQWHEQLPCLNHRTLEATCAARHGTPCITFYCAACERVIRQQMLDQSDLYCEGCGAENFNANTVTLRPI